jgi:NTE family protein
MKKIILSFVLLASCAAWNKPLNQPMQGENASLVEVTSESIGKGELYVGLAFSGGGMRASAFAYGMLEELRAQAAVTGTPDGLLDHVRLVVGAARAGRLPRELPDHQCREIHGQYGLQPGHPD